MSGATNLRPVAVRKDNDGLGEVAVPSTAPSGASKRNARLGVIMSKNLALYG
jgi:hypothetical protein